MKIFAGGIATESNTFSPIPTSLDDFRVVRGADALSDGPATRCFDLTEIWGRLAETKGHDFIHGMMAWAMPSGTTTRAAYEALRDELLTSLERAKPVDIVLLMLHGAMVADGYDDCEEDVVRRVRDIVGPRCVIGVELDLHCHLRPSMIELADLVVTYKEYPHTDVNDRGRQLFELAVATSQGLVRPTQSLFDCQMVGLYPTTREPLRTFVDQMYSAEGHDKLLSISFSHGFQFADVPHVGAKMLAITDNDADLARRVAQEYGLKVYGLRREIAFDSLSIDMEEALSRAQSSKRWPVVVADQADNTGGGAPGDATYALRWMLQHGVQNAAIAILYDPEVVRIAKKAGIGATLSVRLGGKLGPASDIPLDLRVQVMSLRSDYMHEFPQQAGKSIYFHVGDVAALHCEGIDIIVGSERCQCIVPTVFTDLGVDPRAKQVIVVKSYQHFYGAFAPLAKEVIYMAGPGAIPPDPRKLPYTRLDTGRLYPWVGDPLNKDCVS